MVGWHHRLNGVVDSHEQRRDQIYISWQAAIHPWVKPYQAMPGNPHRLEYFSIKEALLLTSHSLGLP